MHIRTLTESMNYEHVSHIKQKCIIIQAVSC